MKRLRIELPALLITAIFVVIFMLVHLPDFLAGWICCLIYASGKGTLEFYYKHKEAENENQK